MGTLVYVDRPFSVMMAVPLLGVQSQKTVERTVGTGFNWLIQGHVEGTAASSILRDIRELLPEELIHGVHDALPPSRKELSVSAAVALLSRTDVDRVLPGSAMSIVGILEVPSIESLGQIDPLNPVEINLPTFNFHGETCFAAALAGDGYRLPIYFESRAAPQIAYCHENPVEIAGVVRWSPPYSPRGASTLNLSMRAAAAWLR